MLGRRDLRGERTHTGGSNVTTVIPHLRLSWGGTIGEPAAEIWTNTLKWANDQSVEPTTAALERACTAVKAPLVAWFTSTQAQISAVAKLTWIKLNYIQTDGRQRDVNTVVEDVTGVAGNVTTVNSPIWVQSYALTLRTGLKRGRGHAGRIFPPVCGLPSNYFAAGGYLMPTAADAMALKFGTCIRDVRNAMNAALGLEQPPFLTEGPAYDAVVISASQTGDARPPQSNEIVSVVCDRVPDIQHRRTNRLPRSEGATVIISAIP